MPLNLIDDAGILNGNKKNNPLGLVDDAKIFEEPSLPKKIVGAAMPWIRPTLEMGGAIGGGILATPETFGLGTVAGAGLGYAAGRQVANIAEQYAGTRETRPLPEALKETGLDVATGMTYEMGGQAALKGLGVVGAFLRKPVERLYSSALKAPYSKKWTQVLPGKEISKREAATKMGLKENIPVTKYGLEKTKSLEQEVKNTVDSVISVGEAKGDVVNTADIISKGLQKAYQRASTSSDPIGAKALVDEIAEKFMVHGEKIPVAKLNQIKRQLYDEVKWGGTETTALSGQLTTMSKKGIAHEAMVRLESLYPELKYLNKKDGSLIDLVDILERTVAKESGKDLVGLGAKVLFRSKIWPLSLADQILGLPAVKSKLAFALQRASQSMIRAGQMTMAPPWTQRQFGGPMPTQWQAPQGQLPPGGAAGSIPPTRIPPKLGPGAPGAKELGTPATNWNVGKPKTIRVEYERPTPATINDFVTSKQGTWVRTPQGLREVKWNELKKQYEFITEKIGSGIEKKELPPGPKPPKQLGPAEPDWIIRPKTITQKGYTVGEKQYPAMYNKQGELIRPSKKDLLKEADLFSKRKKKIKTVGYRYGSAPESGFSYNTREGRPEKGISMASAGGNEESKQFATMGAKEAGRKKIYYEGDIIGYGGDDEPIMVNVREISAKEYINRLNSEEGKLAGGILRADLLRTAKILRAKGYSGFEQISVKREKELDDYLKTLAK